MLFRSGYASADSAEEHGGTTGFARGAPLIGHRISHIIAENMRKTDSGRDKRKRIFHSFLNFSLHVKIGLCNNIRRSVSPRSLLGDDLHDQ